MGKIERRQNGQAAGTRAHVQHAGDFIRAFHPRHKLLVQQFGDVGTRHDHALVDIKRMFAQPGFVGEIRRRQAFPDPAFDHGLHLFRFAMCQAGIEEGIEPVERQVQGMQDQIGRFVEGVVRAVTKRQLGFVEARHRKTQPVAHGDEGFSVVEMIHCIGLPVRPAVFPVSSGKSLTVVQCLPLQRVHSACGCSR